MHRTSVRSTTFRVTTSRAAAATAVAAATLVVTAACSSAGTATATGTQTSAASTGSASSASSPSSTDSASSGATTDPGGTTSSASSSGGSGGAVPTGKQLAALFGTATPPSGFTLSSSGATDSGANNRTPGTYIALKDCSDLTNASNGSLTADYESSEAENEIQDAKDTRVSVLVAAYAPGDADKQWSELTALFAKCTTYQANVLGGGTVSIKATATPVSGLGEKALDLKLAATTPGFVTQHSLLARSGDRIVSVDTNAQDAAALDLQPFAKAYLGALTK